MNIFPNYEINSSQKENEVIYNQYIQQEENIDLQTEILNITKIKEGLYLGDEISGTNLDVVIQFKLTHMINSTGKEIVNAWETIGIKYLTINWEESPSQNLFDSVDEIANKILIFIEDSFIRGEGLLVYSKKGQNRACIVILIYLMKKYKWPLNKSLEFLRNKKYDVDIPNYFMEQLKNFEGRMIKRGENIIFIPWSQENLNSSDEKLMRNTFVNGLKNNVGNAVIVPFEMKKKKHISWADFGKKSNLEIVNLNLDLFFKKNIKNVVSHLKMKPNKSCVKGNKKNDFDDNNDNILNKNNRKFEGNGNMIQGKNKFKDNNFIEDDFINNIKPVNNYQSGINKKGNNTNLKNNYIKNINNNNKENLNIPVNIINSGNILQKENMNFDNNYMKNMNFASSLQPSAQKNIKVNINNIYNNNLNNNNDEDINIMRFNYTQMYSLNNNNINNNNSIINNKNNKNNQNDNIIRNNNMNYSVPQRVSSATNENNNMINLKGNFNIGSINSFNPTNIKNYSNMKENNFQNNLPNDKIIYAEKYEQIVNNNIQNIIINQDSNKQEIKSIKKINSENIINNNINNNNNKDYEIGPIPNINFNKNSLNFQNENFNYYNMNNKMTKSQNIKPQNNKKLKTENQKDLNYNNNLNMNRFEYQNEKLLMNTVIKDNNKFKASDYQNHNLNKNNNFMNYTPINRKQEYMNELPIKNNFLEYNNNNNNKNMNNPINNFNPNLMKKKNNSNKINYTENLNNRKGNIFNRPRSQNGPIKIKNDYSLKKPSTPDQINHLKNNINNKNNNNIYERTNLSRTPTRSDNNNKFINRPSTAPQKEKKNNLNNNIKYGNIKRNVNNNFNGPNKRLPSPQIHSNNILGKTKKNNPRYRAPSPVIRSGNNLNNMGIGKWNF